MIHNILKYKYSILIGFFLLWIGFFDSSNLVSIAKLNKEKRMLEKDRDYYLEEIEKASATRKQLFGNKENLEKFAREKYLMKKDDEDIFIILED